MTFEERLARLERACRLWKSLTVAAVVFGVAPSAGRLLAEISSHTASADETANVAKVPHVRADIVTCRALHLVNNAGNAVGVFGALDEGGSLTLCNRQGDAGISMQALETEPSPEITIDSRQSSLRCTPSSLDVKRFKEREVESGDRNRSRFNNIANGISDGVRLNVIVYGSVAKTIRTNSTAPSGIRLGVFTEENPGGGFIDIANTFGKPVVHIQSSKSNAGLIHLNGVGGEPTREIRGD